MEAASLQAPAGLRATNRPGLLLRVRTDDQLVALFRMGNDEAFDVIHDRYRARLLAYTRQMLPGSAADAEDALQDVFIRAFGALRADGRPVTLRAWLYRVAHNRCIDHLRRPANQAAGELPDELPAATRDPFADVQRRDELRRLVQDIAALPEQQRSALLMREMEGLSYVELGDALGVTVPAVKSLLVRARIGLTDAREARDTSCLDIRNELALSHDRGVRATARSRRHLKECGHCRDYRSALKGVTTGIAALSPSPTPWATFAKVLGIGGAGSAGVASSGSGGAAAVGGSTAAGAVGGSTAGSGLVAAGTAKVAAVIACAAVVGGGAVEATHQLAPTVRHALHQPHHAAAPLPAAARPARPAGSQALHRELSAPTAAAGHGTAGAAGTAQRATAGTTTSRRERADAAAKQRAARSRVALGGQIPFTNHGDDDAQATQANEDGGALAPDDQADSATTPATTTTPASSSCTGVLSLLGCQPAGSGSPSSGSGSGSSSSTPTGSGSGSGPSSSGAASGSSGSGSGSSSGGSSTGSGSNSGGSDSSSAAAGSSNGGSDSGSAGSGSGTAASGGGSPSGTQSAPAPGADAASAG